MEPYVKLYQGNQKNLHQVTYEKNYNGRKVWTVSVDDVQWVEHVLGAKTSSIIQLEGDIRILEAKLKSVDTTKSKEKRRTEKEKEFLKKQSISEQRLSKIAKYR